MVFLLIQWKMLTGVIRMEMAGKSLNGMRGKMKKGVNMYEILSKVYIFKI